MYGYKKMEQESFEKAIDFYLLISSSSFHV